MEVSQVEDIDGQFPTVPGVVQDIEKSPEILHCKGGGKIEEVSQAGDLDDQIFNAEVPSVVSEEVAPRWVHDDSKVEEEEKEEEATPPWERDDSDDDEDERDFKRAFRMRLMHG